MGKIFINESNGWFRIFASDEECIYPEMKYLYYTKRQAIKLYREKYGLKYRKLEEVAV